MADEETKTDRTPLTRAGMVQILGALLAAGGVALYSLSLGVTVLGVLCIVFGVAMERG